jgi:putative Holliday junction resolvase
MTARAKTTREKTAREGRWMAVDYGERRIGLAVSDPTGTIASPAGVIMRRTGQRPPVAELARRAVTLDAVCVVVGLPLDSDGEETPWAAEIRRVGDALGRRSGLPIRFVDERFTTAAALRAVRILEGSTRGRKEDVDALSATVLLQHALALPQR